MHNARLRVALGAAVFAVLAVPVLGSDAPLVVGTDDEIPWFEDIGKAFAAAKAQDRPLMLCINAKRVDMGRIEPAAKELRENTYKDPRVVELARASFVCAFLTAEGTSSDYGELRVRYGIDGKIVSPQHVFAYPDGALILRREYWPHDKGEASVKALLEMMEKALAADRYRRGTEADPEEGGKAAPDLEAPEEAAPPSEPVEAEAPDAGPERAAWIERQLAIVRARDDGQRRIALAHLVRADRDGDCVRPILELMEKMEKDVFAVTSMVRALGRPGLVIAAPPLVDLLKSKHEEIRANAAVSLEYIGCPDVRSDLQRRASREASPTITNHIWRAVGRCGAGESKARRALDTAIAKADDAYATYGPIIGLAYFEKDKRAARAIEKHLVKVGPPRGGRGSRWSRSTHRALLVWCLAEIGDPASADFMQKRMIDPMEDLTDRWVPRILEFYMAVVRVCRGDAEAMPTVEKGIKYYFGRLRENTLTDDARRDRDGGGFTPKAEWEVGGSRDR